MAAGHTSYHSTDVLWVLRRAFWLGAFGLVAVAATFAGLDIAHRRSATWVRHSREVGRLARNARAFALERVAGLRSLMLTGNVDGVAPEIAAHRALEPTLDSLQDLTADNPVQQARVIAIREAIAQWDSAYAFPQLRRVRQGVAMDTSLSPAEQSGNAHYEPVRAAFADFVAAEEAVYAGRLASTSRLEWLATVAILAELLLLAAVLAFLIRRATAQTKSLIDQQHQLEEQAVELELQATELQDQAMELEQQVDEGQELAAQLEETQEGLQAAVTEAVAARKAESAAREELVGVLSRMTDGIIALDAKWRLVYQNGAAAAMTNRPLNDSVGEVLWEVRPWLVGTDVERHFRRAMETQAPVWFEQTESDGREVGGHVEVHAFPSPEGLSIFLRDVTKQRSLEGQFRQAQKMEAVGQLAGGIAHDFNNLLTAIRSYSELLLADLPPDGSAAADVLQIQGAADRAAALTRQLLAYSRKEVVRPAVLDLADVALGVSDMLQRLIGPEIELSASTPDEPWKVLADPGQIEQVIVNLVVNARDAMPRGGRLTVEIANESLAVGDFPWVDSGGDYATLSVTDSGTGMTEAIQSRIFDPFFTTKESGKGTGLGLSTVMGIVKQSGGNIRVRSRLGEGTTFTAYFPRHGAPARRTPASGSISIVPATRLQARSRTVLVIDDEPAICGAVARILGREGYTVLVAQDAETARCLSSDRAGTVDLVLSDIMVPGINGRDLVDEVLTTQPGAKVMFMSGFTDDAVRLQGMLDAGTPFIGKPFTVDELVRRVNEVLSSHPPSAAPKGFPRRKAARG